jgi:hypothetical protein
MEETGYSIKKLTGPTTKPGISIATITREAINWQNL